jgi:hypothetical protein
MHAAFSGALENQSKTVSLAPKTNRRQREAEETKRAAKESPLNPRFLHKRQAFDPFFFSMEREPLPPEKDVER